MSANRRPDRPEPAPGALPWWRHGMVWLVIAGPAAVVVAGVVTIVLAYGQADPALSATPTASSLAARATTPAAPRRPSP
jgi:hypothetical protein